MNHTQREDCQMAVVGPCGGSAPAPPASPKEQVIRPAWAAPGLCPRPQSYADSARGTSPSGLPSFACGRDGGLPFLHSKRQQFFFSATKTGFRPLTDESPKAFAIPPCHRTIIRSPHNGGALAHPNSNPVSVRSSGMIFSIRLLAPGSHCPRLAAAFIHCLLSPS